MVDVVVVVVVVAMVVVVVVVVLVVVAIVVVVVGNVVVVVVGTVRCNTRLFQNASQNSHHAFHVYIYNTSKAFCHKGRGPHLVACKSMH